MFSKIARAITLAARTGPNPDTNLQLRALVEKARQYNMPKDNIGRAISRADGAGGKTIENVVYEGYGPGGVAIIVEAVTDNKNRTAQEVKNIFERGGGSLGTPGSVSFQFQHAGQIFVEKKKNPEEQALEIIDLGVEDVEIVEDGIEVHTKPDDLFKTKEKIEQAGMAIKSAELVFKPKILVPTSDSTSGQQALRLLENLDEHDDVQRVYANMG